jgi:hypothetical protein
VIRVTNALSALGATHNAPNARWRGSHIKMPLHYHNRIVKELQPIRCRIWPNTKFSSASEACQQATSSPQIFLRPCFGCTPRALQQRPLCHNSARKYYIGQNPRGNPPERSHLPSLLVTTQLLSALAVTAWLATQHATGQRRQPSRTPPPTRPRRRCTPGFRWG